MRGIQCSMKDTKSSESDLEVLLTYGFFDEVLSATDAAKEKQPITFSGKARIALLRLTALHECDRLREAALAFPGTQHFVVEYGEKDFVTWCLIGLDCGYLELVSEVAEKYLMNSAIKFGKRPADSLHSSDDQLSNKAICSLYAFEILCMRCKNFDKAAAWTRDCVLLSEEQKKRLIDHIAEAQSNVLETASDRSNGAAEKAALGTRCDTEPSTTPQLSLSTIRERFNEVATAKNLAIGVGGALVILSALANRKKLKKSVNVFWADLRGSFVEVSRHAFGLNVGQG